MRLLDKAYNKNLNFVVALDGPSASGKGHISSLLAKEFSLISVSSSAGYRGMAYICLEKKIDASDTARIIDLSKKTDIIAETKDIDLNDEQIGAYASKLAIIPEIRENLSLYLKELIRTTPRIIMEGREIGTVIAPNADLKIYITASVSVRAERRYKQLRAGGKDCILSDILEQLIDRDHRDMNRLVAPLLPAIDACIIDTTDITPHKVVQKIKKIISKSL